MSFERTDWTKKRLIKKQLSLGLEAAYQANDAFNEIRAWEKMVESAKTPEQLAVSGEEGVREMVRDNQEEVEIAVAQFSAFDTVVGAMIGRNAPTRNSYPEFDVDNAPQLTGEGLPPADEAGLRRQKVLRPSGEFERAA